MSNRFHTTIEEPLPSDTLDKVPSTDQQEDSSHKNVPVKQDVQGFERRSLEFRRSTINSESICGRRKCMIGEHHSTERQPNKQAASLFIKNHNALRKEQKD